MPLDAIGSRCTPESQHRRIGTAGSHLGSLYPDDASSRQSSFAVPWFTHLNGFQLRFPQCRLFARPSRQLHLTVLTIPVRAGFVERNPALDVLL
jgi:hypothetical protein